ncbi:EscT/YscT/HrcT family type III secretion system export apparatus protein [Duganella sp. BJB488]|uniref:type III secretion system export apparatus subunit SctT n=1 Tax=unclassified Duganella TaxID=2636909 RepID=UPI000E34634D|nr:MULTISPECIES: type III secretion system export apparatus subunit SctT [unclassified Duganella]RFP09340.1 EscT/YscT/HrcT family type III secretion system export apparatus protein [Duganella sp. BJB475]RFP13228.1 EscT/YscT/HrcT family type III secretion system export apparatus protein [Duganella sp. BJB489]RFP17197.1 EscT/YscT/HrcT family type III secretion system export apparatus protein [Duganella sp. BJB488]RFP25376.1 EscT/YscT/HrcT family type III secretion system export apparatus protein 
MQDASLIEQMFGLHANWHELLYMMCLSSVRLLVIFTVLPATSDQVLPGGARNGVVYLICFFIAAGQPAEAIALVDGTTALVLVVKEMFIGMVIGYAASTIFWVAQSVGVVIDNMAGFNNIQTSNPLRGEQSTPISNVLIQLAIVLFYASGGMLVLLDVVFASFRWWPLSTALPTLSGSAETFLIHRLDSVMTVAVKLVSPVILVLVLIDLGFGLMARAADKLEPMALSQPIRGAIALLMLVLLTGSFVDEFKTEFSFRDFRGFFQHGVLGPPAP